MARGNHSLVLRSRGDWEGDGEKRPALEGETDTHACATADGSARPVMPAATPSPAAAAPPASVSGGACEAWCAEPCAELNGPYQSECGGCVGAQYQCRPGAPGFEDVKGGSGAGSPTSISISASGSTSRLDDTGAATSGAQPARRPWHLPSSDAERRAEVVAARASFSDGESEMPSTLSCAAHLRWIGSGDASVAVCPILNG